MTTPIGRGRHLSRPILTRAANLQEGDRDRAEFVESRQQVPLRTTPKLDHTETERGYRQPQGP